MVVAGQQLMHITYKNSSNSFIYGFDCIEQSFLFDKKKKGKGRLEQLRKNYILQRI